MKKGESNFNVILSAYNATEVWELIGIFMLSILSKHISKNHIELYRDDSLAISKNLSRSRSRKTQQKVSKIFKEKYQDIIVQCNLKINNYLDITLNLNDGSWRLYRKPNKETTMFTSILITRYQSLSKFQSIEKRLPILAWSKNIFQRLAIYY